MASKNKITVLAVGDVNVNRDKPETTYEYTAKILQDTDITFAQLEAALSNRPSPQIHISSTCCVPAKNVSGLTHAGFDVISFSGNHTMDAGTDALQDTINNLKNNGIAVVGTGMNLEEARRPVIIDRNGVKIGFLAFNSVLPPVMPPGPINQAATQFRFQLTMNKSTLNPERRPKSLRFPKKKTSWLWRSPLKS